MTSNNKKVKLSTLSADKLSLASPYTSKVNVRGSVLYEGYTAFFTTGEFTIYGEKDGKGGYLRQPLKDQYPTLQTLRMNVSEENLPALRTLDEYFRSSHEQFENLSGLSGLTYRSFLRPYTRQDGTTVYSCDLSLDVKDVKGDQSELIYLTKFYDDTDQPMKVKDYNELVAVVGSRAVANVKLVVDYQVRPKNKEFSAVIKAKFVQIKKPTNTVSEIDPELRAVKLAEVDVEDLKKDITLVKGDESMMTKQKMARVLYKETVGKRFRLSDIVLNKAEGSYVGLPPDGYDGETVRPKITFILNDENLENLQKFDQVFSERAGELREMWDITKKSKLDYLSCVKEDNGGSNVAKLELFDAPDNKTKFIVDGKELEWSTTADLRSYVRLGTQIKNPNIVIAKVWHNKQDKNYSLKLKLKSCVLVQDERSKQRENYIEFGKFTNDEELV